MRLVYFTFTQPGAQTTSMPFPKPGSIVDWLLMHFTSLSPMALVQPLNEQKLNT